MDNKKSVKKDKQLSKRSKKPVKKEKRLVKQKQKQNTKVIVNVSGSHGGGGGGNTLYIPSQQPAYQIPIIHHNHFDNEIRQPKSEKHNEPIHNFVNSSQQTEPNNLASFALNETPSKEFNLANALYEENYQLHTKLADLEKEKVENNKKVKKHIAPPLNLKDENPILNQPKDTNNFNLLKKLEHHIHEKAQNNKKVSPQLNLKDENPILNQPKNTDNDNLLEKANENKYKTPMKSPSLFQELIEKTSNRKPTDEKFVKNFEDELEREKERKKGGRRKYTEEQKEKANAIEQENINNAFNHLIKLTEDPNKKSELTDSFKNGFLNANKIKNALRNLGIHNQEINALFSRKKIVFA